MMTTLWAGFLRFVSRNRGWAHGGLLILLGLSILGNAGWAALTCIAVWAAFFLIIPRGPNPARFLNQFMILLNTGQTVTDALRRMPVYYRRQKKHLNRIVSELNNGQGLERAVHKHLRWLPPGLVRLVGEGEKQGALPEYIQTWLDYNELHREMKRMRRNTMMYPALVFMAGCLLGVLCLVFIVPVFQSIFAEMGEPMPLLTALVIGISKLLQTSLIILIVLLAAAWISKRILTGRGFFTQPRFMRDTWFFILFLRRLAAEGRNLGEALKTAADIFGNRYYQRVAEAVARKEKNGETWYDLLQGRGGFPPDLVTALATAAVSDGVVRVLDGYILAYGVQYRIQFKRRWQRMAVAAIVLNGVCWGGLVLSMYLPIFKISAPYMY